MAATATAAAVTGGDAPATPEGTWRRASKSKDTDVIEKQYARDRDSDARKILSYESAVDEQQPVVDAYPASTANVPVHCAAEAAADDAAAAACVPLVQLSAIELHAVDEQPQPAADDPPAAVDEHQPWPSTWPAVHGPKGLLSDCKPGCKPGTHQALCVSTPGMQQRYVSTSQPLADAITLPQTR